MLRITQLLGLVRSVLIYNQPQKQLAWKKFYRELIEPGSLSFDIGAHVGSRARALRKAGAKVIAIEPQQQFARYLARTLPKDIVLVEAAVGSKPTHGRLATSSLHPTVSSMATDFAESAANAPGFEKVVWDSSELVRVTTLDELIKEHGMPSYIKIDVEGYELEVLKGLTAAIQLISFEYLPAFPNLSAAVLDRLGELCDYEFNAVKGEKAALIFDEWQNETAIRKWLGALGSASKSGDLFARLRVS